MYYFSLFLSPKVIHISVSIPISNFLFGNKASNFFLIRKFSFFKCFVCLTVYRISFENGCIFFNSLFVFRLIEISREYWKIDKIYVDHFSCATDYIFRWVEPSYSREKWWKNILIYFKRVVAWKKKIFSGRIWNNLCIFISYCLNI